MAFQIEDRDQHFEALRSARVGRQNRRRKADALPAVGGVANSGTTHGHRTDAGHDLALGQMPMAHQPAVAIIGQLIGMTAEEARNLGLHGMHQQRSRASAQNLGQWIRKRPWLRQLDDIILDHGVSLLEWRSGGVEHPHDTPPYPLTPSPTSAHNSPLR